MKQRTHSHEPFDRERWAESLPPRTVLRVDDPTPKILEPGREEPGLHPAKPVDCEDCGETVMLVSNDRRQTGHCPVCGTDRGP